MAGITLEQAQTKLANYLAAIDAVTTGNQSSTIAGIDGSRTFTKADLKELEAGVDKWQKIVNQLSSPSGQGARMRRATFV